MFAACVRGLILQNCPLNAQAQSSQAICSAPAGSTASVLPQISPAQVPTLPFYTRLHLILEEPRFLSTRSLLNLKSRIFTLDGRVHRDALIIILVVIHFLRGSCLDAQRSRFDLTEYPSRSQTWVSKTTLAGVAGLG